jgi:hypothetical protein
VTTPVASPTPASVLPLRTSKDKKVKQKKQSSVSADEAVTGTDSQVVGGWKIAVRVWPDAEGPTVGKSAKNSNLNELRAVPSLAIPLPNESVYYLLDDFNHHHQHSGTIDDDPLELIISRLVLAGSTHRYASTHRVARKEGHSYQWLQSRCQTILQQVVPLLLSPVLPSSLPLSFQLSELDQSSILREATPHRAADAPRDRVRVDQSILCARQQISNYSLLVD